MSQVPVSREALELASWLYAAWGASHPNTPATTLSSAALDLERAGLDVAPEIVQRLRESESPVDHFEIQAMARKVRAEHRAQQEARVLPPGPSEEELASGHDGFRAAVARLRAKWASEEPEPGERLRPVAATSERPPSCPGLGEPVVHRGGHVFCPSCGEDVCGDCTPVPRSLRYAT